MALLSVIRRWHLRDEVSIREIARRTKLSRNTIKKHLSSGEVEPRYPERKSPSKLDPYAAELTGWLRAMQQALKDGVITAETRFGLHATKHRGVTDTPGTRRDKQGAAGHKSPAMTDLYNHELDVYAPAGTGTKTG